MDTRTAALAIATGVSLTGFAAARAAHQTSPDEASQSVPGRSMVRSAAVGLAAVPLGLAYMYPYTGSSSGRQRAIMVAAGGLQFAAMAGLVNYMNHNGTNDGHWNSTVESMLLSGATGAMFGAAGALAAHGDPKVALKWGAIGFVGGLPDGGWLQLFNRPGRNGFRDLATWASGDVPR